MRRDDPAVGLVAALAAEARCLGALARHAGPDPSRHHHAPARVIVRRAGVGRERAERAAWRLLEEGATALVSWGTAAALRPGLEPGVIALPRRVQRGQDAPLEVDAGWHDRIRLRVEGRIPCTTDVLAEVSEPLRTPARKAQTRASTGADAADMESAAVAAVAVAAGIPFLVIRAISDGASRGVPGAALAAMGEDGSVRAEPLLTALWHAPREIAAVARLAVGFRVACRRLEQVVRLAGREIAAPPGGHGRRGDIDA